MIEARTLPLTELPWHACLLYVIWIIGWICRDKTPQREPLRYSEWKDMGVEQ